MPAARSNDTASGSQNYAQAEYTKFCRNPAIVYLVCWLMQPFHLTCWDNVDGSGRHIVHAVTLTCICQSIPAPELSWGQAVTISLSSFCFPRNDFLFTQTFTPQITGLYNRWEREKLAVRCHSIAGRKIEKQISGRVPALHAGKNVLFKNQPGTLTRRTTPSFCRSLCHPYYSRIPQAMAYAAFGPRNIKMEATAALLSTSLLC